MIKNEPTFGSDPELMLFDTEKNKIVSAIPVVARDKYDPLDLNDGIGLYYDNVLVESSFPPCGQYEIVPRIRDVFKRIQKTIGDRYRIVANSSHDFDEDELGKKPEIMEGELPVEWEIGCNPNFDVYERKSRILAPFSDGQRTGSFHIHIGSELILDIQDKEKAIKLMDIFVGCSSVIFDKDESSSSRRKLYGKAGEFRPTDYGIEYRCLGNYALRSPELTQLCFDLSAYAISVIENGNAGSILERINETVVRSAINTNNRSLAAGVLAVAGLPDDLWVRVQSENEPDLYRDWEI